MRGLFHEFHIGLTALKQIRRDALSLSNGALHWSLLPRGRYLRFSKDACRKGNVSDDARAPRSHLCSACPFIL